MRIIPAIDIIDGKCVRLSKGDYSTKKIYNEDPLEVALQFEGAGIRHLHLVDLDGARSKHIVNYKVLERIAAQTELSIDFGGGLKSDEDLHIAFESGADQITGGSIAVSEPEMFLRWLQVYGSEKVILGADARDGKIAVSGWEQESDQELLPFLKGYLDKGIRYVISTDIEKDGMLQGPSTELYAHLISELPEIRLIASGGISDFQELPRLAQIGCEGAIIGKAIYENKISLKQLEYFILNKNSLNDNTASKW